MSFSGFGFCFLFSVRTLDNSFSCSWFSETESSCIGCWSFLFTLASDLFWEFTAGVWLEVNGKSPCALVLISWLPTEHYLIILLTAVKPPPPRRCSLLLEMSRIRNSHWNREASAALPVLLEIPDVLEELIAEDGRSEGASGAELA